MPRHPGFFYPHSLGTDLNYSLGTDLNELPLHSLGTDLNDQSLGDSLNVPTVWDGPLMSDAPRGVE